MLDNLNKEFIVYKSDLLEAIDKNNEKFFIKIDNVKTELRSEMRILETKLESRIDKVEAKLDRLTFTVLFAMFIPIIIQIITKFVH